jgi:hypothetical protein
LTKGGSMIIEFTSLNDYAILIADATQADAMRTDTTKK